MEADRGGSGQLQEISAGGAPLPSAALCSRFARIISAAARGVAVFERGVAVVVGEPSQLPAVMPVALDCLPAPMRGRLSDRSARVLSGGSFSGRRPAEAPRQSWP